MPAPSGHGKLSTLSSPLTHFLQGSCEMCCLGSASSWEGKGAGPPTRERALGRMGMKPAWPSHHCGDGWRLPIQPAPGKHASVPAKWA